MDDLPPRAEELRRALRAVLGALTDAVLNAERDDEPNFAEITRILVAEPELEPRDLILSFFSISWLLLRLIQEYSDLPLSQVLQLMGTTLAKET